jgi:hypothetical protein
LNADLELILSKRREIRDLYYLRDYLYLEQRLSRLLSWRETFAGAHAQVRTPFTDVSILDVMRTVPTSLKLGKRLYKDLVAGLFPSMLPHRRARSAGWSAGQWFRGQLGSDRQALIQLLTECTNPLDAYLPPDVLQELSSKCDPAPAQLRRWRHNTKRAVGSLGSRFSRARSDGERPRPRPISVHPAVFLVRAAFLRELYRQRQLS